MHRPSLLDAIAHFFGRIGRARFVIAYALTAGAAMGVAMFGANVHKPVLARSAAAAATALTVLLVAVVTWYRRENVLNSAIVLALAWTSARLFAVVCATALLWKSLGAMGFATIGVLFGVPIAILEAILIGGALVALLRRVRSPATMPATAGQPNDSHNP